MVTRAVRSRIAAFVASAVYLAAFLVRDALLPEFVFRDAEKIQAQVEGSDLYAGTSFDAIGKFYSLLGGMANTVVAAIGVMFICTMLGYARRTREILLACFLIVPCAFFNLFVASKDTVVVLISILIVWAVARLPRRIALITAIACYALYALLVRSYFALIILAGAVIWIVVHARFGWKLAVGVGSVAVISALPPSAYELLMGPRDRAVDYLLLSSPFGARTAFYNLVAPDSFHGFVVDYAYAFVRLNFAPVFSLGGKEVLMQLFILAALWPAVRALRWSRVSSPMMTGLASLLLGHIAVSVLFEPDLGSYLRHLSSVALFSMVLTASMVATKGLRPGRRCGVWETTHKGLHGSACRSVQHSCRGPRLCWAPPGP